MLTSRQSKTSPTQTADPKTPGAKPVGVPSLISKDVEVKGAFVAEGDVQFDGQLEGDLRAASVVIGEGAHVKGEVVADRVRVCGTVEGAIRANRVELAATAVVRGDILHAALAVETGASLDGKVCCTDDPKGKKRTLPTAKIEAEIGEHVAKQGAAKAA